MSNLISSVRSALQAHAPLDRGATAVEYGLMVGLIAVVIVAAVFGLGLALEDGYEQTCDSIVTAQTAGSSTECPS